MQRRLSACLLATALLVAGPLGLVRAAVPNDSSALRDGVTVAGMLEHLEALDAIGAANGNTRVDDTPGYEQSVEYVADRLTDAGYDVDIQPFTFDAFIARDTALERVSPDPRVYVEGFLE